MSEQPHRVVIAGGGVGGIEAALALKAKAGRFVAITIVSSDPYFVYRPLAVAAPFGRASTVRVELAALADDRGFELVSGRLDSVDLGRRHLVLEDGRTVGYDHLVLALGARAQDALPGALTFGGPADVGPLRFALEELDGRGGGRVAFVARTSIAWSLPLYELAVLTAASTNCTVALITHERRPLEAFGPDASAEVAAVLADHGIEVHCSTVADRVVDGGVRVGIEGRIDADLVVALPVLLGPDVAGLPKDRLGFVAVDDFCRIVGATGAYAVGDMTARAVKQGGLAAQQADVAAACIAAAAGALLLPEPYRPVLRATMLTADRPHHLRGEPGGGHEGPADDAAMDPWWPPHKIMGAHLAPYLASHGELLERTES